MTRAERLAGIYQRIESNVTLLGATVVEDKLQDEVPETLEALLSGGIKVWMLTGDKLETAESIGFSCRLLAEDMDIIKCSSLEDLRHYFNKQ